MMLTGGKQSSWKAFLVCLRLLQISFGIVRDRIRALATKETYDQPPEPFRDRANVTFFELWLRKISFLFYCKHSLYYKRHVVFFFILGMPHYSK
jgi:hypothetical protein